MTKTQKVLTAAVAVLVLLLALSCAGIKTRESQFPLARQVWTSVKPLAELGAPRVPFSAEEVSKLDSALQESSRELLSQVSVVLVRDAADAGVDVRTESNELTPEVGRVLKGRNVMFADLLVRIAGGAQ
jgi:cytochrome c556